MKRRDYGSGSYSMRGGRVWIHYYKDGVRHSESTGSDNVTHAKAMLKQRLAAIASGEFMSVRDRRITVDEIFQLVIDDYRMNDKSSLKKIEQSWQWQNSKHPDRPAHVGKLKAFFGGRRASEVSTTLLNRFVLQCQAEDLSNATINRYMSALKRAFNLAYRSTPRKVQQVPVFPQRLKESKPRQGFIEQAQYDALCKHASGELWLRTLLALGYTFGFRRGELLNLRCEQVDLAERTIRLYRGETKSGEGRLVKLTQETFTLLSACVAEKQPTDHVFTRADRTPIMDFRKAWDKLCKAAGVELLFHDLRRSAARNLIRAGIPQHTAQAITGHKTASVFSRYDIVSTGDLEQAARRIEQAVSRDSYKIATKAMETDKEQPLSN